MRSSDSCSSLVVQHLSVKFFKNGQTLDSGTVKRGQFLTDLNNTFSKTV